MRKLFKLSLLSILLVFAVTSCSEGKLKDGAYNFEVYATNDLHGRFFDSLYVSNNAYETHP